MNRRTTIHNGGSPFRTEEFYVLSSEDGTEWTMVWFVAALGRWSTWGFNVSEAQFVE